MPEAQLDIFAPPQEAITIAPTRRLVYAGASADGVPRHTYLPSKRPKAIHTDEEWLTVLHIAEAVIRHRRWTRPHPLPLDLKPEECLGGGPDYWYNGTGVAVDDDDGRRCAGWSALLRGLREQREHEPHIALARDLAHAYSATETYDRYFVRDGGAVGQVRDGCQVRDGWRERVAVPYLAKLKEIVAELGGDPDFQAHLHSTRQEATEAKA